MIVGENRRAEIAEPAVRPMPVVPATEVFDDHPGIGNL